MPRVTIKNLQYQIESRDRTIAEQLRIINNLKADCFKLEDQLKISYKLDDILYVMASITDVIAHVVQYATQPPHRVRNNG